MRPIQLVVIIPAPPDRVWAVLADLGSHHEWMADAGEIRFDGTQKTGVGTRIQVPTRVGPFRTTDLMTVVVWDEGNAIAVDHVGTVSGSGRFDLEPKGEGTRVSWSEELRFPWWLGGRLGVWAATPILKRIWRGNLSRLAARVTLSDP